MRLPSERNARCVAEADVPVSSSPPLTFGSHKSKTVHQIRSGHSKVKASREEFIRLVTRIDATAPFYGVYAGKKNVKWKDDSDFRPNPELAVAAP